MGTPVADPWEVVKVTRADEAAGPRNKPAAKSRPAQSASKASAVNVTINLAPEALAAIGDLAKAIANLTGRADQAPAPAKEAA